MTMNEKETQGLEVILPQAAPFHEAPCGCVRVHTPRPATIEKHHIFPQAVQLEKYGKLVEPETVALCPSSHRSVHYSIDRNLKGQHHVLGNAYLRPLVKYALRKIRSEA